MVKRYFWLIYLLLVTLVAALGGRHGQILCEHQARRTTFSRTNADQYCASTSNTNHLCGLPSHQHAEHLRCQSTAGDTARA